MSADTILFPTDPNVRAARDGWAHEARVVRAELTATATERDRARRPPRAEVDRLKRSPLINLLIPRDVGGEGGTLLDAARAVTEVAKGDGSIGALLAFHLYASSVPRLFDVEGDALDLGRRSAAGRWFWGNVHQPQVEDFVAAPDGAGGYVINGRKSWNTGVGLADVTTVVARRSDAPELLFAVVPTTRDGIAVSGDWRPLGLRLAETVDVEFADVAIAPDEVVRSSHGPIVGFPPQYGAFATTLYAGVLLGSAWGAFERARRFTLTRGPRLNRTTQPRQDPHTQAQFGDLWGRLKGAEALLDHVSAEVSDGYARRREITQPERDELTARSFAARSHAAEVALVVTQQAFEVSGTDTTRSSFGLDRHWRDVRTLIQHDPLLQTDRGLGDRFLNDVVFDIPAVV